MEDTVTAFKKQDDHIDIKADKAPDDIDVFITDSLCCSFNWYNAAAVEYVETSRCLLETFDAGMDLYRNAKVPASK